LLYWGVDDYLVTGILVLSALSFYFSLDITKITKGAPRGWYFVMGAFALVFIFSATQLYFDIQSPADYIDDLESSILLVVGVLFVAGLYLLDSSFLRRSKAIAAG
jgi:glycopeptide antibiotics resistance protein